MIGYYLLAADVWRLVRLRWVMETSLLKTLARKHRSTVSMMARKYKATIDTPRPRKHPVGAEQVIHVMRPGHIRVSAHRVGRDVGGVSRAVTRAVGVV